MRSKTHHPETLERLRTLFAAWCGGPLSVKQVAQLVGLEPSQPFQNALLYLWRNGEIVRPERGHYQPKRKS